MLLLPGGTFDMGSGTGDAAPVHSVTLDPFFLDQFEVTNARYQACVDSGACTRPIRNGSFTHGGYFNNPEFAQFPVVNVTWDQAQTFCAAQGLRLPTEAEWEFAASSGRGLNYPWGDQFDPGRTTVSDGDTRRVGSFSNGSSEQGVFDLAGNALEWVADWYQSDYYAESPDTNPPGPNSGGEKVLRGGSFGNPDPSAYLSTRRFRRTPQGSDVDIGFRCAGSVP
jgi:formylglycine-generating enzyme required for sulfatase activity